LFTKLGACQFQRQDPRMQNIGAVHKMWFRETTVPLIHRLRLCVQPVCSRSECPHRNLREQMLCRLQVPGVFLQCEHGCMLPVERSANREESTGRQEDCAHQDLREDRFILLERIQIVQPAGITVARANFKIMRICEGH